MVSIKASAINPKKCHKQVLIDPYYLSSFEIEIYRHSFLARTPSRQVWKRNLLVGWSRPNQIDSLLQLEKDTIPVILLGNPQEGQHEEYEILKGLHPLP